MSSLKKYSDRLSTIYEKPIDEPEKAPFEEPGWWKKLGNNLNAWFKERQVDYYSWIGDNEKAQKVKIDLLKIYDELGDDKLFAKVRLQKEFVKQVKDLDEKLASVCAYLKAMKK